jgi:hypothetical protein
MLTFSPLQPWNDITDAKKSDYVDRKKAYDDEHGNAPAATPAAADDDEPKAYTGKKRGRKSNAEKAAIAAAEAKDNGAASSGRVEDIPVEEPKKSKKVRLPCLFLSLSPTILTSNFSTYRLPLPPRRPLPLPLFVFPRPLFHLPSADLVLPPFPSRSCRNRATTTRTTTATTSPRRSLNRSLRRSSPLPPSSLRRRTSTRSRRLSTKQLASPPLSTLFLVLAKLQKWRGFKTCLLSFRRSLFFASREFVRYPYSVNQYLLYPSFFSSPSPSSLPFIERESSTEK